MTRRGRLTVFALLFLIAVLALELPDEQSSRLARTRGTIATAPNVARAATPAPPQLSTGAVNQQDRVDRGQRRREIRDSQSRPLLPELPIDLAGVHIDIVGLAEDDRTTILTITPGRRGRAFAAALYQRALTVYRDSGNAYEIRWAR